MKFKSQFTIQTQEKLMTPEAERFNGWAAMLGFVAAVGKEIEKQKVFAEKLNGRAAMIGFVAAVGAYLTTGQIIPGFV